MALKVSSVTSMKSGSFAFGHGFNITTARGRPIVNFVYDKRDDAEAAATKVRSAFEKARAVVACQ
jgi:nicotinic acid phosphoribosyltransferase